jgi:dCTP deaminase
MVLKLRSGTLSRVLLSDRDIRAELAAGDLRISPLGVGHVQPASVDLRLGHRVGVFDLRHHLHVDPADIPADLIRLSIDLADFVLRPGGFLIASTLEEVTIPDDMAAQIDGISTLGRLGLVVHSTAGWVDPGFRGSLTLELSNAGPLPIVLTPAMRIAQLVLFRCSSPAERPYGSAGLGSRYQGQQGPTPAR